ncbi:MAG: SUMF1/EgtB/PvdO family nonheme iron enzyme [Candidatus Latescibacteria bacterium]|nr:SUMF1/EgtB/PvdO family nonheme iron enzyme [Candidatus Latescibacterota bacterium]
MIKIIFKPISIIFSIIKFLFGIILKLVKKFSQILLGFVFGLLIVYLGHAGLKYTSTDDFCNMCHAHPHVNYSWKKSTHYKNESGVVIHCVECHLPAGGLYYFTEKARLGIRDAYSTAFKDVESIDWDTKSMLEHAVTYTYDSSCIRCHQDLYSRELTPKGVEAHEYYMKNTDKLRCINCHITVGHYREEAVEEEFVIGEQELFKRPERPFDIDEFKDYTQTIPGTNVTFDMIAIEAGTFNMGSPEDEPFRNPDEGPPCKVQVSQFWMGEIEVSWREFDIFYSRTATMGKNEAGLTGTESSDTIKTASISANSDTAGVDAITGPTPPYGSPDQGWGKGYRPAITMTHHAAETYCRWLSQVTGKKFRLPTEAEWEYACRAGTTGPYYFDGDPEKLTRTSWINRTFRKDTSAVDSLAWSQTNSNFRTNSPYKKGPNPWGLYNMIGNVKEFCLDWYAPDAYIQYSNEDVLINPKGPSSGKEHVIRGGSYNSDPADLRSARRDRTYHDRWMMTDPQSPKSVWWYSDSKDVGFRVVREYEGETVAAK